MFPVGNLAPEGSVIKATAIDASVVDDDQRLPPPRSGARVRRRARGDRAVKGDGRPIPREGDVIVLIGNGPSGTGMQETAQITTALNYLPWGKHVALLTDGRFSGFSSGACIGHIGPEALQGGPIGRVRDDDVIEIVIDRRNARADRSTWSAADGDVARPGGCAALLRDASRCIRPGAARVSCPTTRGCGRRCSARAAARGAAASTTSTASSRRSNERRRDDSRTRRGHAGNEGHEGSGVKLHNTTSGVFAEIRRALLSSRRGLGPADHLPDLAGHLRRAASGHDESRVPAFAPSELPAGKPSAESRVIAPIGSQEVWAAGVTYLRSRTADTFTGRGDG